MAERFAGKLRTCAEIAIQEFGGSVHIRVVQDEGAAKSLRRFPGIGGPGAEKILLFGGIRQILALDSNGLRVLPRLGYGTETGNYAADYRSVQQAAQAETEQDHSSLM